jgi:hypothetical protein
MQLMQNFRRGSADGLSASMFVCAITANVTGSTGILVRLQSRDELVWQLPWLMGACSQFSCGHTHGCSAICMLITTLCGSEIVQVAVLVAKVLYQGCMLY